MSEVTKFCLFGDLHLKPNDPLGTVTDGVNSRLIQKLDKMDKILEIAEQQRCSYVIELGDTFDRINPPDYIRTLYARKIKAILDKNIGFVRILGNHETTGHEAGGAGMDTAVLSNSPFYKVINKPDTLSIQWKNGLRETTLLLIPEVSQQEILDAIDANPNLPIFGHFGVEGATYPSGVPDRDGIPQRKLVGRDVFLGHIHARQNLVGGKVRYIGAVARANFGDKDVPTGCCIVSVPEDGSETPITEEYIDIEDTQLVEFEITPENDDLMTKEFIYRTGFVAKLRYHGPKEWYIAQPVKQTHKALQELGASRVFQSFTATESEKVEHEGGGTITELIIAKARADFKNPEQGLKILKMAQNEVENSD